MNKTNRPTESELEILSILWEKENATVREVHDIVQKTKDVGYTTTLKLMQIMNEKGLVTRNVTSKTHIYSPTLKREKAQEQFVGKIIQTLFSGSTSQLVLQALGKHKPTDSDLAEIKSMIQKLERK
ncbi:MAG: BlaI/MecI/CopY family transcriptional regulator [Bacteroidetes bacterium]|nr:BlaI/MecI/CopY family transcriptional regulator [Bacteroidota bacterium]